MCWWLSSVTVISIPVTCASLELVVISSYFDPFKWSCPRTLIFELPSHNFLFALPTQYSKLMSGYFFRPSPHVLLLTCRNWLPMTEEFCWRVHFKISTNIRAFIHYSGCMVRSCLWFQSSLTIISHSFCIAWDSYPSIFIVLRFYFCRILLI